MKSNNKITKKQLHFGWDNSLEPALVIDPGCVIEVDTLDASGGQLNCDSSLEDVSNFDFSKVNPTFGPVYVKGAKPGDALKISVLDLKLAGWGWTANIPGFGLLADQFTDPALHIWDFDPSCKEPAQFKPGGKVPLKPFPGIMGNALPDAGCHSVVNPRMYGGNMDTRDMGVGTEVLIPVGVPGSLFSCGDGHAAQGDGEICGTAIEAPMTMILKLDLVKNVNLRFPQFSTKGPVTRHFDTAGYYVRWQLAETLCNARKIV